MAFQSTSTQQITEDLSLYGLFFLFIKNWVILVLSGLIKVQIKFQMIAEVRKDYVFKVTDSAVAPELKSKPQRAIIIIAGFLGGILGLIIISYRAGWESHQAKMI